MERSEGFVSTALTTGYDPEKAAAAHAKVAGEKIADYHREKILGIRMPNGVKPLKSLNGRHQRIVALHLTGQYSGQRIAQTLGCSAFTVHRTLNDPLVLTMLNEFYASVTEDLRALFPLAVDAVRDGLESADPDLRLRAVDRYERMAYHKEEAERDKPTVNIAFIQNTRERFFGDIRAAAEEAEEAKETEAPPKVAVVIDVEPEPAESE